jgi:hypothetical protein
MVETGYCRKCRRTLPSGNFYNATDLFLDTNGLMSICADCIDDMFNAYLETTKSVELSVHKICAILNVIYLPAAVEAAKKYNETRMSNGRDATKKFFGRYKSKIKIFLKEYTTQADNEIDMTYKADEVGTLQYSVITEDDTPDFEELKAFWGTENRDDIEFLENEMSKYRAGYVLDTPAQTTLVKELCYKILEIDKDRRVNKSVDAKLKSLQALMTSMGISPNMEKAAGAGRSAECFGAWIKDIEEKTPAEWHQDKSIFRDVDNIEEYSEKYITSPLRSFITGNKEFDISDIGESGIEGEQEDE